MRTLLLCALSLLTCLHGFSQVASVAAPTTPPLPKDPAAILAEAAPFYDFNDPALVPWHLKASYQLYDEKGAATKQGTFEYWWASPKIHRTSWTRADASHTTWSTLDGRQAFVDSGERLGYFESSLLNELLSPMPTAEETDPSKIRIERQDMTFGGQKFPCVVLRYKASDEFIGQTQSPTYCFDPAMPVLQGSFLHQGLIVTESRILIQPWFPLGRRFFTPKAKLFPWLQQLRPS